ncbi:phage tail fiber domain-containing protein [Methylomonas koyamae]|uniref:phage tail fiber domain-containing protein n=1 Tax=Methylomonas koyamae TaxID=702114 RepID=UPI0006D13890|nr:phage tail fiber protein [Methylomonas koyamae]BBL57012.1 hypothetical protein MKFW12EY_06250 [Methylomonas koyamae]
MSISIQDLINEYTGNGSTTAFPFTFKILTTDQLSVVVDGVVVTTGFSVSIDPLGAGGTVTFYVPPANATNIRLFRQTPILRSTDFIEGGPLDSAVLDGDLDYLTSIAQEIGTYGIKLNETGKWDANNISIINLASPENSADAVNKLYVDQVVTRLGNLTVPLNPTDNGKWLKANAGIASWQAVTNADLVSYLGYTPANKAGDTFTGSVSFSNTATFNQVPKTTATNTTDTTELATVGFVNTSLEAAGSAGIRQTVLSGPVDSTGASAFGGSTGSTTVTASGTLVITAANGNSDYKKSITNPSWTGLSTNGTMYLYLDINGGLISTGSTTLQPNYQWGGTYSTTNNQHTFNIQEMTMKVGNGSIANTVNRVFVGEVTVAGGVVTAITWYQLLGRFTSAWTNTLPGINTTISATHKLGVMPDIAYLDVECITADITYSVGEQVVFSSFAGSYARNTDEPWKNKTTVGFTTGGTTAFGGINKSGTVVTPTAANWKYRFVAQRGW